MDPLTMAAIAAGGGILEGAVTSGFNMFQAEQSRDYNRDMASSNHQREVKDLRAAGLNPILSAKGGGSAVAPSPTPQAGNFDVTNKAMGAIQMAQNNKLVEAQIRDVNATASAKELANTESMITHETRIARVTDELMKLRNDTRLSEAQRQKINQEIANLTVQKNILHNQDKTTGYQLSKDKSESQFYEGAGGDVEHWLKMLGIDLPGILKVAPGPKHWPKKGGK